MCAAGLEISGDGGSLLCASAHRFDIARHGYVSLLDGRRHDHLSDTASMVAARARVQESGLFGPVTAAVVEAVDTAGGPDIVLDAGAGTGHYLAATLARRDAVGLGLDLSKYCARAVLSSHPRATAVVADIWRPLPVRSGSVGAILSIFSPRNVGEFSRVLHPDGSLVVVTPRADHLDEIVGPMDMLAVGAGKDDRLRAALGEGFDIIDDWTIRRQGPVTAATVADLVAMGPSAFHRSPEQIAVAADDLVGDRAVEVTVSVTVTLWRPRSPCGVRAPAGSPVRLGP